MQGRLLITYKNALCYHDILLLLSFEKMLHYSALRPIAYMQRDRSRENVDGKKVGYS